MRFAVIGGGSWGTTLADMLARAGQPTTLWVREQKLMATIKSKRVNEWYLKDVVLCDELQVTSDPATALKDADAFLFAVPSQFFRATLKTLAPHLPHKPVIICANKGIELTTHSPMSQVVFEELASLKPRYAMLSGPSFAFEVAKQLPTTVSLGCKDKKLATDLQEALSTPYFRVYTNPDYKGVELGGALKNIIAIAAGIADGLGFGYNARAGLITRGLVEMSRLGKKMGADPQTFMGLSGMGDLVLTCTGELSRNRQVGLQLGKGRTLIEILDDMTAVAEGVKTTEAVYELSRELDIELPITEQVYAVLHEQKDPKQAVMDLMARNLKDE